MMQVAIVDDIASERQLLRHLLTQYAEGRQLTIEIEEFDSGKAFLSSYAPGTYDLVFLDIFMDDQNGVDCALELRQKDASIKIIFLTTSSEFGVKSYDVRAVDYIVKPASAEKLDRALRYCKFSELHNEPMITVMSQRQPLQIELNHILYADLQNRITCIHLRDCLLPISGTFSELSEQLTSYSQFMSCFKGVVVNLHQVNAVASDHLILNNGELLPISRRLQKQVLQRRLSLSAGSLRGEWV